MDRIKQLWYASFWSFVVLAIIAFVPSSGIITLTVPDDQYGSAIALPDTSHQEKRAAESGVIDADLAATNDRLNPHLISFADAVRTPSLPLLAQIPLPDSIRGPPAILAS